MGLSLPDVCNIGFGEANVQTDVGSVDVTNLCDRNGNIIGQAGMGSPDIQFHRRWYGHPLLDFRVIGCVHTLAVASADNRKHAIKECGRIARNIIEGIPGIGILVGERVVIVIFNGSYGPTVGDQVVNAHGGPGAILAPGTCAYFNNYLVPCNLGKNNRYRYGANNEEY